MKSTRHVGILILSILVWTQGCAFLTPPVPLPSSAAAPAAAVPAAETPSSAAAPAAPANVLGGIKDRILHPIETKITNDAAESGVIGQIVGRPEIVQCAEYIQGLQKTADASNEMLAKLQAEDTRNLLVASLLKDYFTVHLTAQGGQDLLNDFETNFPAKCGTLQSIVNQQLFRALIFGASRGAAGGLNLPGLGSITK